MGALRSSYAFLARATASASVVALLAGALVVGGCASGSEAPAAPSKSAAALPAGALVKPGTLTVAIDRAYPPYSAPSGSTYAGLDADLAASLADQLGLKVAFVPYDPAKPMTLPAGRADIALGALSPDQAATLKGTWVATYAMDGPALFAAEQTTRTAEDLAGLRIGAQKGSEAYWRLADTYGEQVREFPTTREAMQALAAGEVDMVGADAIVGSYIARDFPKVAIVGTVAPAHRVGVVALGGDPALRDAVRSKFDALGSGGVLTALLRTWTGDVSQRLAAPATPVTGAP